MNPTTPNLESQPLTQLRKAVFGSSLHNMRTHLIKLVSAFFVFGMATGVIAQTNLSEPVFMRHLTTAAALSVTQGWHETLTDLSVTGRPIRIAGKTYEKGLGTHAPGEMVFRLNGKHKKFAADVGVDDEGGPTGSVVS